MVGKTGKQYDVFKKLPCEIKGLSSPIRQLIFMTDSTPPNPRNLKCRFRPAGMFSLSFLFKFLDPLTGVEGLCDKNKIKSESIFEFYLGKGAYHIIKLLYCERCLIRVLHRTCFGFITIYGLLLRNAFPYYSLMWFCLFVFFLPC